MANLELIPKEPLQVLDCPNPAELEPREMGADEPVSAVARPASAGLVSARRVETRGGGDTFVHQCERWSAHRIRGVAAASMRKVKDLGWLRSQQRSRGRAQRPNRRSPGTSLARLPQLEVLIGGFLGERDRNSLRPRDRAFAKVV